jgi:hypothetical protein
MQYERRAKRQPGATARKCALQRGIFQFSVFALLSLGFAQVAPAGVVATHELTRLEARQGQAADLERFLARGDVAAELERFGVSPEDVTARVLNLTDEEIAALHGRIEQQVAGGDAIAVIGVVFLVLLILELVGVTDIFKAI